MSIENVFTKVEADRVFSLERLDRLKELYNIDDEKLLQLHAHLGLLNGSIYASVSLFEVHLRNIIIECMDHTFGVNWMDFPDPKLNVFSSMVGNAKVSAKSNIYSKMPYRKRKAIKGRFPNDPEKIRKSKAIRSVTVSRNDIIPYLFFSFWKKLFTKPYEHDLWRRGLKKVFPSRSITRGDVSDSLETCYKVRNRISHNEFVHPKLCRKYIEAIEFLTSELGYGDKSLNEKLSVFHQPYIANIQSELSNLEEFLSNDR